MFANIGAATKAGLVQGVAPFPEAGGVTMLITDT
jgi:hypothetical protein